MSNIIQLGEHLWVPPPAPSSISDVLYAKESPHNQYWRRSADYPKFFLKWDHITKMYADHTLEADDGSFISLSRHDTKRFIELRDQEMKRRRDGIWFMNNGELTYMTGGHYFMLQWCHLQNYINPQNGSSFGDYMEYQAHLHYFLKLCKEDKDCLGTYILKPKKTGVTQLLALDFLDESTRMKGRWFGMMSKALVPDCRDNNFGMYKLAFENLPNVFKPVIANENLTMMYFGNPVNNKNSRKHKGNNLPQEFLNTRVSALATKDDAFDGGKPFRAWTDELPKYIDPYPDMVGKKTSAAVKMQEEITGKWWISSYTPEDDSESKKQAEKIYYEAKLRTKDVNTGRTKNELYAYFISVLDSAKGSFDIYGKADRRKNQIFISNEREKLKNDKAALQASFRVLPTTEDEAWRAGGGSGSTFDNLRLSKRKFEIEENERLGKYAFVEANLEWTDELKNRVRIVVVTEDEKLQGKSGLWRFYEMDKWRQDSLNEFVTKDLRDANGNWRPSDNVRSIGSMDPTNYSLGNLVLQKSKNSMWVFSLPDSDVNAMHGKNCTGRHIAEYLHRHDRPGQTLDDLKKAIFLFGAPFAIEGNMSWAITRLIEDGLQNFVLVIDSKTKAIVPYNPLEHQSMITTQRQANSSSIDGYVRITSEYIGAPTMEGEFDNLQNVDSVVALEQLMDLNPLDTRAFDHAMGFMVAVQAMHNYIAYLTKKGTRRNYQDQQAMEKAVSILMG